MAETQQWPKLVEAGAVVTVEEQCPECYQSCTFCSDWRWMIRAIGCRPVPRTGTRCPKNKEKGETCKTCGLKANATSTNGGGKVRVERRILPPSDIGCADK